jgi:hypothetical protein
MRMVTKDFGVVLSSVRCGGLEIDDRPGAFSEEATKWIDLSSEDRSFKCNDTRCFRLNLEFFR